MLEMANYIPSPELIPAEYRLGIHEMPDGIQTDAWRVDELPAHWSAYPYPYDIQEMGSRWLEARRAALLFVPSAAIPAGLENSVVFNPLHTDASRIRLVASEHRIFSSRMFTTT